MATAALGFLSPVLKRLLLVVLLVAPSLQADDLRKAMADVERLRGRTFAHDVAVKTIDRGDLRTILEREIGKSLPYSAADYVTVLKALQLVDPKQPAVIDKMLDLYESQVLAFYDPPSHTYFAISGMPPAMKDMPGSDALQQSVVVHELTHAIQDQRFDASVRDFALQQDIDAQLAYHALLEGEASLVMTAWLLEKSGQSLDSIVQNDMILGMMLSAANAEKTIDATAPAYFVESLKFPYIEGLRLVVEAYKRGGWKEVDKLHEYPPVSTREVLHSAEYFARIARGEKKSSNFDPQPSPDVLTVEHLGEFHWRYLVGADHATGWVNDRVTVNCNGIVHAETWWENADRAAAFRDAYVKFLRDRGIEPRATRDGAFVDAVYLVQ
jgi:hypothetical protein